MTAGTLTAMQRVIDAARASRFAGPRAAVAELNDALEARGDLMLWWRPEGGGYTTALQHAGLYTESEARSICAIRGPSVELAYRREDVERAAGRVVSVERRIEAVEWGEARG